MVFSRHSVMLLAVLMLTMQSGMAQSTTPAASAPVPEGVLAVVNGQQITQMDFDQLIQQYRPEARDWATQNKGRVMRDLVTLKLLAQEARKQHLDQSPAIRSQIKLRISDILARSMVQQSIADHAQVTPETIQQHYEASKADYTVGEEITASHILLAAEPEAHEVLKELEQGKDFAAVAKAKSIGPSASKGGALGTFGRGRMVAAFEEAAFVLKTGEISAPVQTRFGYHVIKVTDRTAARTKPFEEVRDEIRNALTTRYVDGFLAEIRGKASVQILQSDYAYE